MNLKGIIDKNKSNNKDENDTDENDENKNSDKETSKTGQFLAELGNTPGTVKMTVLSSKAIEEKSISSFNNAMLLIKELTRVAGDTVEEMPFERGPSQVQLAFNIIFTTDGRAVISKSDKETNLKVVLTWKHEDQDKEKEAY